MSDTFKHRQAAKLSTYLTEARPAREAPVSDAASLVAILLQSTSRFIPNCPTSKTDFEANAIDTILGSL